VQENLCACGVVVIATAILEEKARQVFAGVPALYRAYTVRAVQLAAEVLLKKPLTFDPVVVGRYADQYDKPMTWIEHYTHGLLDQATFEMVEFAHYEPRDVLQDGERVREIGEPSWTPLDRATVEALVGQRV